MTVRGFFRRFLAGLLSLLMLGLGQTYNRQPRKGIFFLLLVPAWSFAAGAVRFASTFPILLIGASLQLALLAWAILDAAICGGDKILLRPGFRKAGLWFSLAVFIVILNGCAEGLNFYINHAKAGLVGRLCPTDAMPPALVDGDRFMVDTHAYLHESPRRGDVVLFQMPGQPSTESVKRVIALGGDVMEGKQDGMYLNGRRLDEAYLAPRSAKQEQTYEEITIYGPLKVPQGTLFVLGDNRQDSYDSRYYGAVPASKIKGRALYVYLSHVWSHIGRTIH
ncbi:MAG TPA: signal peptidase I [Candidatus Methylomirabilis sp.]|nr:signal peptidase I [Candidatus Methylomirabilis sp.]